MNVRYAPLLCVAMLAFAVCASQSKETESQPREDEIAEDCVAFVRATKVVPAQAECVGCANDGVEALSFRQMHTDRISCSAAACEVIVTLRASFNAGTRGTISGGLSAWIPPEQRQEYLNGRAPGGEQVYRVKITYKRTGEDWRAIEFDKAPDSLSSEIEGVILVSPSHPGPTRKDQPDAAPAANVTFSVMKSDAKIASFTTDGDGRFRIALPPGHYTVLRGDPGARIGHWHFEAEVKPGEMTSVRWVADSGMR